MKRVLKTTGLLLFAALFLALLGCGTLEEGSRTIQIDFDDVVDDARKADGLIDSYNRAITKYYSKDYVGVLAITEEMIAVDKTFYLAYKLKALLLSAVSTKSEEEKSRLTIEYADLYWKYKPVWQGRVTLDFNVETKDETVLYDLRGMSKRALFDYKGAIEDANNAIRLALSIKDYTLVSSGYYHRGYAKEYLGDFAGAEKDHIEAIIYDPVYWWPHQSLLYIYSYWENADRCFDMFYVMAVLDPDKTYKLILDKEFSWLDEDDRMLEIIALVELGMKK